VNARAGSVLGARLAVRGLGAAGLAGRGPLLALALLLAQVGRPGLFAGAFRPGVALFLAALTALVGQDLPPR